MYDAASPSRKLSFEEGAWATAAAYRLCEISARAHRLEAQDFLEKVFEAFRGDPALKTIN